MDQTLEYSNLVKFVTPSSISVTKVSDYENELVRQKFAGEIKQFMRELPKTIADLPDNKGWTVNSHSIAFKGNTLIISVLLQRLCA